MAISVAGSTSCGGDIGAAGGTGLSVRFILVVAVSWLPLSQLGNLCVVALAGSLPLQPIDQEANSGGGEDAHLVSTHSCHSL
jgi:hypothetical protein